MPLAFEDETCLLVTRLDGALGIVAVEVSTTGTLRREVGGAHRLRLRRRRHPPHWHHHWHHHRRRRRPRSGRQDRSQSSLDGAHPTLDLRPCRVFRSIRTMLSNLFGPPRRIIRSIL